MPASGEQVSYFGGIMSPHEMLEIKHFQFLVFYLLGNSSVFLCIAVVMR